MTQDELKALIEDLRLNHEYCPKEIILQAADELERLALPEQEPVAWQFMNGSNFRKRRPDDFADLDFDESPYWKPLYTNPPQRTWVGLFDEEIEVLFQTAAGADEEVHIRFARAIESKMKELNT